MSDATRELPKSYPTEEEIEEYPNDKLRYPSEALVANIADDMETSWQRLTLADPPPHALMKWRMNGNLCFIHF